MLQRKIVDPAYSYLGDFTVSFSCDVEFYIGESKVASIPARTTRNLQIAGWADEMASEVKRLADDYEAAMIATLGFVQAAFPQVATPDDAVIAVSTKIEEVCNGLGS